MAFAAAQADEFHKINQSTIPTPIDPIRACEQRLNKAVSLLEFKVQQLVERQHQALTQLHLRLQEVQAMGDEITDDMFFQADVAKEKASIQAELEEVNAREYEIRVNAHSMLKSLEHTIRTMEVSKF